MIKDIGKLTLAQFVDMMCGETQVLLGKHEIVRANVVAEVVRDIALQYRAIADPAGMNAYLKQTETRLKAKISAIVFTMCDNLLEMERYDKIRIILKEYGIDADNMKESRIKGMVKSRLAQAKRELAEAEKEESTEPENPQRIRGLFDEQTAALMAHFKFQIDPDTIKASLYARLVERYNREIKAKLAALKKKRD